MNLGDVREKTVPKMTLVAPQKSGGAISTRTFILHRCHKTIGVLGAVSVATAIVTPGCLGHDIAHITTGNAKSLDIEHPSGATTVIATLNNQQVTRAEVLRTARKIMAGMVF
jgi:4-oxalomesaconate tautomerase